MGKGGVNWNKGSAAGTGVAELAMSGDKAGEVVTEGPTEGR